MQNATECKPSVRCVLRLAVVPTTPLQMQHNRWLLRGQLAAEKGTDGNVEYDC